METEKAFILINTVKCIGDEYKAVTQSGTEIYVKKSEVITYIDFPKEEGETFGFVKVNGKAFTADTVKIIIQIYEGLIRRFEYETDKENLKRLQDAEIGKSRRKQSNADRIRSMTDEELDEIIMCPYDTDPSVCNYKGVCLDCCLEWLKYPVED